jgi:hypothetical protein
MHVMWVPRAFSGLYGIQLFRYCSPADSRNARAAPRRADVAGGHRGACVVAANTLLGYCYPDFNPLLEKLAAIFRTYRA